MNAPANISYEDRLKARYAAARSRIFAAGTRAKANDNEPARVAREPLWMCKVIRFDAHVIAYHAQVARRASPKRAFIIERAQHYGITASQVMAKSRCKYRNYVRQMIWLEIKEKFDIPHMDIAHLFGGLDHSTVVNGIDRAKQFRSGMIEVPERDVSRRKRRSRAKAGSGKLQCNRTPLETEQKIVDLWKGGMRNKREISRTVGISDKTVFNILRRLKVIK